MNILRQYLVASAIALAPIAAITLATPQSAHAAVKPEKLGELPNVFDAAISPNGDGVAVIQNVEGKYGVAVYNLRDLEAPVKGVLLAGDIKPAWVKWANDGRVLVSVWQSEKMGGTPFRMGSIYSFDVDAGKGDWLVERPKRKRLGTAIGSDADYFEQYYNTVVDFLDDDPDHILMAFMDRYQNVRPVHKVNVATGNYDTVERATQNIQSWVTDNTGTVRVAEGLVKDAKALDQRYMRIRDAAGEWAEVDQYPGIDANDNIYGFTSDPNEMVVGLNRGRDTEGLYVYDLRTKSVTRTLFHNDEYDVAGIVVDADTGDVIGARYTGEEDEIELFDDYDTTVEAVRRKYPGYQVQLFDTADNGGTLLFKLSNPYDPGLLMMLESGQTEPTVLTPIRKDLPSDELGVVIPVKYQARDGQRIPAFVTLPPTINETEDLKDLPFIVLPHGGPFARDAARFDWFAQFFATRGYGVLQMNFRGSTGYGESFAKAGRENWSVMREDMIDGTRWLVEKGYADPERICAAGWSYGGYAALMGGLEHPELFSCVISIAGLSDIPAALSDMEDYRFGRAQQAYLKAGFADKDDQKASSPARIAQTMSLPTFIAHGTLDQQVQYGQHSRLHRALKKSDAKITEMTFKDEDHYMSQQENRQAMLKALDKFLVSANGKSEYMK